MNEVEPKFSRGDSDQVHLYAQVLGVPRDKVFTWDPSSVEMIEMKPFGHMGVAITGGFIWPGWSQSREIFEIQGYHPSEVTGADILRGQERYPPTVTQAMAERDILTAREALLEILRIVDHPLRHGPIRMVTVKEVQKAAQDGLARSGMENFETSDHLADRLAEAHSIMGDIRNALLPSSHVGNELLQRLNEALALPPDIEAMVDRRLRR